MTTRQNNLFVSENWTKIYQSFRDADFQSYDYETLRSTMVQYLRTNYSEDFNDYIESSEFLALIDLIAYFGQSLAFRQELNARENFLETAERKDSVLRLAKLLSYQPKRNQAAKGLLKLTNIQTTENVYDSAGINLADSLIIFNDSTNPEYLEKFAAILNAAMANAQNFGNPALSSSLSGIKTDLYELNTIPDTIPVLPFNANVSGETMTFEIVNGTFHNREYIYEASPKPGRTFNILYRQDGKGASSSNTGFFVYFKQGTLENVDFNINNTLTNRLINVGKNGINNDDVWLYNINTDGSLGTEWTKVPAVTGSNVIYNSLSENVRSLYSINSKPSDQIDLVFGDGVFADIPVGNFRSYHRISNGRSYRIKPEDIRGITLDIPYISRTGNIETLTIGLSLEHTIDNASTRDTISDIKLKAPQQYYTQNRMVNGEDYNIFPLTNFNNVIKSKAINRTSSGISRFLDVRDVTGKYSSTNIYGNDGAIYKNESLKTKTFNWNNDNDIYDTIKNIIEPILRSKEMVHFYYDNFESFNLLNTDTAWNNVSIGTNRRTGFFSDSDDTEIIKGTNSTNLNKIRSGSLITFMAPHGKHFTSEGMLVDTTPNNMINIIDKLYAGIVNINNSGLGVDGEGRITNNVGAININENIPTGAILSKVQPKFITDLPITFETEIFNDIKEYKDFALGFNYNDGSWYKITSNNMSGENAEFNITRNDSGSNMDASWLIRFKSDGNTYTIHYRGLEYFFSSVQETRFYFDKTSKVYDSTTGLSRKDNISVLGINSGPDSTSSLIRDKDFNVYDMIVDSDGYTDNTKVMITFADNDDDGIIDNPNIFKEIVGPIADNESNKLVFLKRVDNTDNYNKFVVIGNSVIDNRHPTKAAIIADVDNLQTGSILYATTEKMFFVIGVDKTVSKTTDYKVYEGRDGLKFHYIHNAPNNRRIDPSPANIIDIFVLTKNYSDAYNEYTVDTTGVIKMPDKPTTNSLQTQFSSLEQYKTISDAIVFHSAKFKPLFGTKATDNLQAKFKVVKNKGFNISDSEIKSKLIAALNDYFNVSNWDFGETFYFSELSAYLHTSLTPYLNSVVIVPSNGTQVFGSLYQISCEHDEIFTNTATVNDVEIIDAISASKIKASGDVYTGGSN